PSRGPTVERRVEAPGTASGFANRKDAIDLPAFEVPGADAAVPQASVAAEKGPSPMNRADAIELPEDDRGPKQEALPSVNEIDLEGQVEFKGSAPPPKTPPPMDQSKVFEID